MNFVEKWGTGIGKIKASEPKTKFEEVADFFMVNFRRKSTEYVPKQGIERFKITKDEIRDKGTPKNSFWTTWEKVGRNLGETWV